ncbi:MAG: VWA domain-containing protein [Bacteroidia bacterium]
MLGLRFTKYTPGEEGSTFDKMLKLFFELLQYTAGDVSEALSWMNELDRKYKFTTPEYGMADFIKDLKDNGYIKNDGNDEVHQLTSKSEQTIRKKSLEEIFGKLKKSTRGNHKTTYTGQGDELSSDVRPFQFGDSMDTINYSTSIRNAHINHGIDEFHLTEDDLEIQEREYKTQNSTVLMIDISHSMILYGEDRITPAKKVAMALAELIKIKYPKDTLDIIVFGDDAWPIQVKDLPYLQVGPFHTNTVAGLELAMDLLRRRKAPNKQIFMITDGKPTCLKEGNRYYKNSFGLDRKILNRCFNMAAACKRLNIPVTTFMIANDPYLQDFVREFTRINNGRAFYSSLTGLGEYIFEDYIKNRKKTVR